MENGQAEETSYEIVESSSALMAMNSSEIDTQIATAKRYPRSVKKFQAKATELATLDEDMAASCFYALPRGGKTIRGESIRFAELAIHAWGNARAGARITEVGKSHATAQATAIDLETNVAVQIEKRVRITKKNGDRYDEDMITNACNAAASKAFRDAVFKIIPKSLLKPVVDAARKVAVGDMKSLGERRTKALEWFAKVGATQETILKKLGRAGVTEIDLDDLETLTGLKTAIKDGDLSVEEAFAENAPDSAPEAPPPDSAQAKLAAKKEELKKQADEAKAKLDAAKKPAADELWSYKIQGENSAFFGQTLGQIRESGQLNNGISLDDLTDEDKSNVVSAMNLAA